MVYKKLRRSRKSRSRKLKSRNNKRKSNTKNKRRRRRSTKRRNSRRNQRGGAGYTFDQSDVIGGKPAVNSYYTCYSPVLNGGNRCKGNINVTNFLEGGNGEMSNFDPNMVNRTFGCRQPVWKPSCV